MQEDEIKKKTQDVLDAITKALEDGHQFALIAEVHDGSTLHVTEITSEDVFGDSMPKPVPKYKTLTTIPKEDGSIIIKFN